MERFYSAVNDIKTISDTFGFETEAEIMAKTNTQMDKFRVRIMFSGGFSSGKSAAINTLLGRELLTEDIDPETAIATELVYDSREYIEAVIGEDRTIFQLSEESIIDVNRYDYLVYHINNPQLKRLNSISNYVIVDMPGFNSGIESHNKAVLRYAGNGNAYVLVIDCEDGEIKQSLAQFIEEIRNFDNNLVIVVSKTDKKMPSAVETVVNNIAISAEYLFGYPVPVETISKFDESSSEKLCRLIETFNSTDIFMQTFYPVIMDIANRCIYGLKALKNGLSLNADEINSEINLRLENKARLEKKLIAEERNLAAKMANVVKPQIIDSISCALNARVDSLAAAAETSNQAFSELVNRIVSSVLVSATRQYVEQSFAEFADNLVDVEDMSGFDFDGALDKVNVLKDKLGSISEKGLGDIYRVITTILATITNILSPVLELVVIFAPTIVDLLQKSRKRSAHEELKQRISDEIIPSILYKLEPEIERVLITMKDELVEEVRTNINQQIQIEVDCLDQAKAMLDDAKLEYENEVKRIDEAITKIEVAMSSLCS